MLHILAQLSQLGLTVVLDCRALEAAAGNSRQVMMTPAQDPHRSVGAAAWATHRKSAAVLRWRYYTDRRQRMHLEQVASFVETRNRKFFQIWNVSMGNSGPKSYVLGSVGANLTPRPGEWVTSAQH